MKTTLLFSSCLLISSFSYGQSLDYFVQEVLNANPEIQAVATKYKSAIVKKGEANTLPNTQVGLGYFTSEPETRTGAQEFKVSIKQMLPWFGTITAREDYKDALARNAFIDIGIVKRKLITTLSQTYYRLFTIRQKQEILKKNKVLLKTYEKMALTTVETGESSVVNVLKLQMLQNNLEQLDQILEQQFLSEQTHINTLCNRTASRVIEVTGALKIPPYLDTITRTPIRLHPEILKYDKLYASITKLEVLNKKEQLPMIGFGVDYIAVSERPNMNFSDNGKDILMPMISLSIPLFNKKHTSKTQQHQLQQNALLLEKQAQKNKLTTLLEKAIYARTAAKISYDTTSKNLEQVAYATQILLKSYEAEAINFNDLLALQALQLELQMQQTEAVQSFYIQSATIHYLSNSHKTFIP